MNDPTSTKKATAAALKRAGATVEKVQDQVFESLHQVARAGLEFQKGIFRMWGQGMSPGNVPADQWMYAFEPMQDSLVSVMDRELGSTKQLVETHASYAAAALDGMAQLAKSKGTEEFWANVGKFWDTVFGSYQEIAQAQIKASESLVKSMPFWNSIFGGYREMAHAQVETTLNPMKAA